jgi:hypothetical protein
VAGVIIILLVKSEPLTVNVCACDAVPEHFTKFTKLEVTEIFGVARKHTEAFPVISPEGSSILLVFGLLSIGFIE